jgi:predicted TIM-barrel fold metal-dependent hydrolase
MIFDTHLHLIDRTRLHYPWLSALPPLDRDWSYEDYAATARRIGITKVLHMEVDVAEADIDRETSWIAELMARPDSLIKGAISSVRPESEGFEAWLERVDRSIVRGVRRVLHVVLDEVSQSVRFRDNLRRLGQAGLPFDICMLQRQLPLARALADTCPDTILVLDHLGVPSIADGNFEDWASQITALAKRPNVTLKLSGISAYGPPDWTLATLQPYVDHALSTFGTKRIVWGSDSPVCTLQSSLSEWVATTQSLISALSTDERSQVMHDNAEALWFS